METSELINQYMVKLGLKPADIVKRVGVSRGTVSLWRNGLSRPKGRNLFKLAEVLGLDAKDLDEGIETPTKRPIVENASIVGRIELGIVHQSRMKMMSIFLFWQMWN